MYKAVTICLSFLLFMNLFAGRSFAQQKTAPADAAPSAISPRLYYVPAALIGLGALSEAAPSNTIISKYQIQERLSAGERVNHFDDYLQFAPIAAVAALPLATDIPHRSPTAQLLAKTAVSEVLSLGAVYGMKAAFDKDRPSGGRHSMPSGHTAQAFVGAQLLYLEYRDTNKWIAYGGYPIAAFVGVERIINNDHWFSDVMVGAGIGMAIPVAVYWANDKIFGESAPRNGAAGEKAPGGYTAFLTPALRPGSAGVGVAVSF